MLCLVVAVLVPVIGEEGMQTVCSTPGSCIVQLGPALACACRWKQGLSVCRSQARDPVAASQQEAV